MLCRRHHQVFKAAEHVRADGFAFVAARQRRDQDFRGRRDTQVIRPERHQPLDERPIRRDSHRQRRDAFLGGNLRQLSPELLSLFGRLAGRPAKRADRLCQGGR